MRPAVKRRLLTLAAAASLLLCVGTLALWVRSYRIADAAFYYDGWRLWWAQSWAGGIKLYLSSTEWPKTGFSYIGDEPQSWAGRAREFNFSLDFGSLPGITFPHWVLCTATGIPAMLLIRTSRRRRPAGVCPACGYDLRATPARCSECGAVPAAPAAR